MNAELAGSATKIAAILACQPECHITHPSELRALKALSSDELQAFAGENGWRVIRRVGGRQLEFYNDVSVRRDERG